MATGNEQFIGMYAPRTLQEVLLPQQKMALLQQQNARDQELLPIKENLMKAQTSKAMQPQKPNVWEQKMAAFEQLAREQKLSPEQINKAKGRFLIADLMKQGGQQINMDLPGGGSLNIGGGADSSGMDDIYKAFGMQSGPTGIKPGKTEQSAIQRQMRGIEQALTILPDVQKYIQYKDPSTAALADFGGFAHKIAPGLSTAMGIPNSEGLSKYQSALAEVKESLLSAYGLRSTDRTNADVQKIIEGGRFENPEAARQRMHDLMIKLRKRYEKSGKNLVQGYSPKAEQAAPKYSDADIAHTAKLKGISVDKVRQMLEQQ